MSDTAVRPLALTMGDPAGIGGECTLRAWLARRDAYPFVALDDPTHLNELARRLRLHVPIVPVADAAAAVEAFADALPVIAIPLAHTPHSGQPNPENAPAIVGSITRAVAMALNGAAGAIVTNPINKAALYATGFAYPGHTEFLAALTDVPGQEIMMLASPLLRVVPVTVHVSLRDAIAMLTPDRIAAAARVWRSPASIRTPANRVPWAGRKRCWSRPRSIVCGPRAWTCPAPGRRTACSPAWPARATTRRSASITTRR
jgi:4-hydroxythreonine-4-phosphate dehydrogenase